MYNRQQCQHSAARYTHRRDATLSRLERPDVARSRLSSAAGERRGAASSASAGPARRVVGLHSNAFEKRRGAAQSAAHRYGTDGRGAMRWPAHSAYGIRQCVRSRVTCQRMLRRRCKTYFYRTFLSHLAQFLTPSLPQPSQRTLRCRMSWKLQSEPYSLHLESLNVES